MNLLKLFRKKKAVVNTNNLFIGKTENCVWCHQPHKDIGCGIVSKGSCVVCARFCSHQCLASQTNFQNEKHGWTKSPWREWIKEDGLEFYDEPFYL